METRFTPRFQARTQFLAFIGLLAASSPARAAASINAGTIVIVAQAKNYIIFAADSRIGASNGTTVSSVDDSYCKIAPLRGNTIFAAAGIVTDPIRSWAADTEMDRALSGSQTERLESAGGEIALNRWAEFMMQKLFSVPRDQLLAYARSNDGVAATGVLASFPGARSPAANWPALRKRPPLAPEPMNMPLAFTAPRQRPMRE